MELPARLLLVLSLGSEIQPDRALLRPPMGLAPGPAAAASQSPPSPPAACPRPGRPPWAARGLTTQPGLPSGVGAPFPRPHRP